VGGWLLLLCVILTVWNPASLALRLASIVANFSSQSGVSLLFLAARFFITSIGVAAGLALLMRRPWAVTLAKAALILFCIAVQMAAYLDHLVENSGVDVDRVGNLSTACHG